LPRLEFLDDELSADNACLILKQSIHFDEMDLVEKCLMFIDECAEEVFGSEDFFSLDQRTLNLLLARDTLKIEEKDVFSAVNQWSEDQCRKGEMSIDPANKRKVLGEALYLIRMSLMTPEEFTSGPIGSKLVNSEEAHDVYANFFREDKSETLFAEGKRAEVNTTCMRFLGSTLASNSGHGWRCGEGQPDDSLWVECDNFIRVKGIAVYGPKVKGEVFQLYYELSSNMFVSGTCRHTSHGNDTVYNCMFDSEALIEAGERFCITVTFDQDHLIHTYHGADAKQTVVHNGATFVFSTHEGLNNNTTRTGGQIPGIIFEVN